MRLPRKKRRCEQARVPITRGVGGPGLRNSCALCCGSGDALRYRRRLHRCSLSPRARGGLHSAADCRARSRGSRVDRLHCPRQQDPNFADQTSARPRPTRLILSLTHLPRGSFAAACARQVQALVSFFFTLRKRGLTFASRTWPNLPGKGGEEIREKRGTACCAPTSKHPRHRNIQRCRGMP